VYFETTQDVNSAIQREKQIKGWTQRKKLALIGSANPTSDDLSAGWFDKAGSAARKKRGLFASAPCKSVSAIRLWATPVTACAAFT
jgi:hypothetical protein